MGTQIEPDSAGEKEGRYTCEQSGSVGQGSKEERRKRRWWSDRWSWAGQKRQDGRELVNILKDLLGQTISGIKALVESKIEPGRVELIRNRDSRKQSDRARKDKIRVEWHWVVRCGHKNGQGRTSDH